MQRFQILIILLIFAPIHSLWATNKPTCGTYVVKGLLKKAPSHDGLELIVYGGSLSETRLAVKSANTKPLFPYLNRPVRVSGRILRPIRYYRSEIDVDHIEFNVPDYLRPDHGDMIKPVKISACR